MAVQSDRPKSSSLLVVAVSGSLLTLVVAYLAAAAFQITSARQGEAKQLRRDLSELHDLRAAQAERLSGLDEAMRQVVAQNS